MPTYSIIIPVYNVENYISNCLDSILNQNFMDYEIVLVNDGSKDSSGVICDYYAKKFNNIHVIHQQNLGVSIARQVGIRESKGSYLLFVDSDDMVTDNYFECIKKCPKVDVVRFGSFVENKSNKLKKNIPLEEMGYYDKNKIISVIFPYLIQGKNANYYCPSLWSHCFKRELFIGNMVQDQCIKIGEDGACVIPCIYNANDLYVTHECIYIYRYNSQSATKKGKVFQYDDPIKIVEHLNKKINVLEYDFQEQLSRKIVHELFHVVISYYNSNSTQKEIKEKLDEILDIGLYTSAIESAYFSSVKAKILNWALKERKYGLFKFYNKFFNKW